MANQIPMVLNAAGLYVPAPSGTTLVDVAGNPLGGGTTPGFELIEGKWQASGTSLTITVPADTLSADGHHLYVEAFYSSAAAAQTPQLTWGATLIKNFATIGNGVGTLFTARIWRSGATAQKVFSTADVPTPTTSHFATTAAETLSGTIDVVADWAAAGSNIVFSLKVWKATL